jgi:hypothetical protein
MGWGRTMSECHHRQPTSLSRVGYPPARVGQLRANHSGWSLFNGKYTNILRFKKEWTAYRETYHSIVNDDLAAKTLREKCVKGDVYKMVGHLEDLREIWDTLDKVLREAREVYGRGLETHSGIQEVQDV